MVQALAGSQRLAYCALVSATGSEDVSKETPLRVGGGDRWLAIAQLIVRTAGEDKCRLGGSSWESVKEDDATQRTRR